MTIPIPIPMTKRDISLAVARRCSKPCGWMFDLTVVSIFYYLNKQYKYKSARFPDENRVGVLHDLDIPDTTPHPLL